MRKLVPSISEKPWGSFDLPTYFQSNPSRRVGEISFLDEQPHPLLIKYIFTTEKLSVQVHPNDVQAKLRGLPNGKTECWYIVDALPGAEIGLGLVGALSPDEFRKKACDGTIEQAILWEPVKRGDFFLIPAGTVHAIGAGLTIIEIQQHSDVTYRLHDYGRPRDLHVDDGTAVADLRPYPMNLARRAARPVSAILLDGPLFSVVRADRAEMVNEMLGSRRRWIVPIEGSASSGTIEVFAGECMLLEAKDPLSLSEDAVIITAVEGPLSS